MFIIRELIADTSFYRKYFLYISDIIDLSNMKVNYKKIKNHHIIIVEHTYFGINNRNHIIDRKKWENISKFVIKFLSTIENKICISIGDCHEYSFVGGIKTVAVTCKKFNIDYIVSFYDKNPEINRLKMFLKKLNVNTKFICITNMIKKDVFKDYKLKKKYDIVYYGAVNRSYPLRQKLCKLLRSKKFNNIFKVKIIKYGELKEEKLSKILNQSYLCIATCSKFDYLVKKYFEISASKSLIIGNMSTQGKPIFKNNYILLRQQMSDDKIISIIKKALRNKDNIIKKSTINYNKVHKYYTICKYHKYLYHKIVEDNLKNIMK